MAHSARATREMYLVYRVRKVEPEEDVLARSRETSGSGEVASEEDTR